jgi:hypothetical protein
MELKVLKVFKDKGDETKIYKVGDSINVDDINRVNDLVSRGLCVIVAIENKGAKPDKITLFEKEFDLSAVKEALVSIGIKVAPNAGVNGVNKSVSELTDEQKTALSAELIKE